MVNIIAELPPLSPSPDGVIYVGKTRVMLDTVIAAFNEGATPEEIAQQYPAISLADLYSAIAYYLGHRADVEAYLRSGEQLAQQVQAENEARFNPIGIRQRLLARRQR